MIILASQSTGRLSTLRAAGIEPLVRVSSVDEPLVLETQAAQFARAGLPKPTPAQQVVALAQAKAREVAATVTAEEAATTPVVVGCDSMLEIDGEVVGKPENAAQARERWRSMRGRRGVLHTGHCVLRLDGVDGGTPGAPAEVSGVSSTVVHFAMLDDVEIDAYIATQEPLWCAGAFAIDGLGGAFVTRMEGDPHGVVGISLPLLREQLAELGIRWTDLWERNEHGAGTTTKIAPGASDAAL